MGRGKGKYSSLVPEWRSKELEDISSPSKKHQDNNLAPSHSTEKLATVPTATGTGAGWIFVRVLACVGWGWLGFFAFTQINLEMECRGASFIVAQLRKTLICGFCEGLGDNVPLAFNVVSTPWTHQLASSVIICEEYMSAIYMLFVFCVCISDLFFSLLRQSLLAD